MKRILWLMLTFILCTTIFASTVFAKDDKGGNSGQSGTTLSAAVTGEGFRIKKQVHDWNITKSVNISRPVIERNKTFTLLYTLQAIRFLVSTKEQVGVRGTVTVTNGGGKATENLKIVSSLENISGTTVTIVPTDQLQPGQTQMYPIEILLADGNASSYKLNTQITITNHSGSLGTPKGPNPKQGGINIPINVKVETVDATATITDVAVCPAGFTCTPSDNGPWTLNDSGTISYSTMVTNISAPSSRLFTLTNTATLTESTSNQLRPGTANSLIFTGCGCTKP
ncbi:hypothetical protein ACFQI7_02840 [Paenibacillus allorhizosphaerae]|uniref:Uncharacterized protein n=1 Tax=Paenibacillus allorhizosphaerae TaxID=2849866 RepID=A0ABM8VB53_9BACL|nr:hypothetical protein [Paenibacillus allorhizosphaerae]CAG7618575.1 hypothetical protein PAECIP111802_00531 [Paenibacillus allorhizosphaerae]